MNNLELLAFSPGYIDVEKGNVRDFYEKWAKLNQECISAGHEDGGGNLSFVAKQLECLLKNFPEDKTTIGVLEVFPPRFNESAFLFGSYITTLARIAKATSVSA